MFLRSPEFTRQFTKVLGWKHFSRQLISLILLSLRWRREDTTSGTAHDTSIWLGQLATSDDVDWCYRLFLGREPDKIGKKQYSSYVQDGSITRDELISYFISAPEFHSRLLRTFAWRPSVPVATKVGGVSLYLNVNDKAIGEAMRRSGVYEPAMTSLVRRFLRPGDTFVDVGASVGYFSAVAGPLVGPSGQVIAIEPGPQNQSVLLLNLAVNGVANPEVCQVAVSDTAGLFTYSPSGANGFLAEFTGQSYELSSRSLVRAVTLDSIIGFRQPRMIKVDVEGHEWRVLLGATDVLRRCRPILLLEFSPPALLAHSGISGLDFLSYLSNLGYELRSVPAPTEDPQTPTTILATFEASNTSHIDIVAWTE